MVGLLLGGLLELALVPRLGKAPKVILMVATIGAAQLFLFVQAVLPDITTYEKFPTAFDKQWEIGDVIIRSEHVIALVVFPVLVGGLTWFLNRTRHGTAVRAAADNPDAARLSGISTKRVSFVVWSLAGGLAAVATILSAPLANANVASTGQLGPGMLLRTLTVAVIAGMASMPIALGAGVVLGVVEAVVFYNHPTDPGLINALLFVTVLVAVLVVFRSQPVARHARAVLVRAPNPTDPGVAPRQLGDPPSRHRWRRPSRWSSPRPFRWSSRRSPASSCTRRSC